MLCPHAHAYRPLTGPLLIPLSAESCRYGLCFRNMSVYDGEWRDRCLKTPALSHKRRCGDADVASLLTMALFDGLILNKERLHPGTRTALSGSISTVLTGLSWICVGVHSRRALPSPVCA